MEILPFKNTILPTDVVHIIYKQLCVLKQIPVLLKEEILMFYNLQEIIHIYKKYFINCLNTNLYLYWLQNNLILYVNDNIPVMHGVSKKLLHAFPKLKLEFLFKKVNDEILYKKQIFKLWSMLDKFQKENFYEETLMIK